MYRVLPIDKNIAAEFISRYSGDIQEVSKEDLFLGVYDSNHNLVALQIYATNFTGYGLKNYPEHVHLKSLFKIPGTEHGVFESVLNYIKKYVLTSNSNIYLEVYEQKLKNLYKNCGFKVYNRNYPNFMVLKHS